MLPISRFKRSFPKTWPLVVYIIAALAMPCLAPRIAAQDNGGKPNSTQSVPLPDSASSQSTTSAPKSLLIPQTNPNRSSYIQWMRSAIYFDHPHTLVSPDRHWVISRELGNTLLYVESFDHKYHCTWLSNGGYCKIFWCADKRHVAVLFYGKYFDPNGFDPHNYLVDTAHRKWLTANIYDLSAPNIPPFTAKLSPKMTGLEVIAITRNGDIVTRRADPGTFDSDDEAGMILDIISFITITPKKHIAVWPIGASKPLAQYVIACPDTVTDAFVSPNGDKIAWELGFNKSSVWISQINGKGMRKLRSLPISNLASLTATWSPDETLLTLNSGDSSWSMSTSPTSKKAQASERGSLRR